MVPSSVAIVLLGAANPEYSLFSGRQHNLVCCLLAGGGQKAVQPGVYQTHYKEFENDHPAIISTELFRQANPLYDEIQQ